MASKYTVNRDLPIEPSYFSCWGDSFLPRTAYLFLPIIWKFDWITPNLLTVTSFLLHVIGCIMLFATVPHHFAYTVILLPVAYLMDCLDGRLARTKGMTSDLGDYLDKTLDVIKLYATMASLGYAAYLSTSDVRFVFLGFTAAFFFSYRFYLKSVTIFDAIGKDPQYLAKCKETRIGLLVSKTKEYAELRKTFAGSLKGIWLRNKSIFAVDEAEVMLITVLAALTGRVGLALWVLGISQVVIALWRMVERGYQLNVFSQDLYLPMRK
jgi:phosphatidylglycerophosphate synthase